MASPSAPTQAEPQHQYRGPKNPYPAYSPRCWHGMTFGAWMALAGGKIKKPPTVTSAIVAKLAHPDFLIEVEGLAVLP